MKNIDKSIADLADKLSKRKLTQKQIAKIFCDICKPAQKELGVC